MCVLPLSDAMPVSGISGRRSRARWWHVDFAPKVTAFGHDESRRRDITGHRARGQNLDPLTSGHTPGNRAHDHHSLRGDGRADVGTGPDAERVIGKCDRAFHLTVEREILGGAEITLDDQRLAEIDDEFLRRSAIDRSLRGHISAKVRRLYRLISFQHVDAPSAPHRPHPSRRHAGRRCSSVPTRSAHPRLAASILDQTACPMATRDELGPGCDRRVSPPCFRRWKRPHSLTCRDLSGRAARRLAPDISRQRYDERSGCATTASVVHRDARTMNGARLPCQRRPAARPPDRLSSAARGVTGNGAGIRDLLAGTQWCGDFAPPRQGWAKSQTVMYSSATRSETAPRSEGPKALSHLRH
jgi:hypothetical protein